MKKSISFKLFIVGLIIIVIAGFIPSYKFDIFDKLKPMGLATIFICPVIGIIGLVFAIKEKRISTVLLNLALVFSFFIVTFLAMMWQYLFYL